MWKILFLICVFPFILPSFAAEDCNIFVDLTGEQKTVTLFQNLTAPECRISVININSNVSFFVIQTHTFTENITLSYKNPIYVHSYTTGNNIGLVWKQDLESKDNVATFYLQRHLDVELHILIIVTTYTKHDPIPGGCNLVFETEVAPYQKINETEEIITVMSQPPSLFSVFCNETGISTDMYYLYLNEGDSSSEEYFEGIKKMATAETILKYGTMVPKGLARNQFKQMYNKYKGTGRIVAVVSTYEGRMSAYVPIASYGCNVEAWEEDCIGPVGEHWKLFTALLLICGLILCLGGHRFFRFSLFITGYMAGFLSLLTMVTVDNDFSSEGNAVFSLIMGIFFAITWVFLWWKFGMPIIAVALSCLLAGIIIASIFFYTPLGLNVLFVDKLAFWSFVGIILVISLMPLIFLTPLYHIMALSLLGSYAIIVAMTYYVGGNLAYILINTYRRIAVKDFGTAVIDPPYQMLDVWQTIFWMVIFVTGVCLQHRQSLGRPPFPPHRSGVEVASINERTRLLQPELPPPYRP